MKKRIYCLIFSLVIALGMNAVPALNAPFTVLQKDGTVLSVMLQGDEDFSYYTTTDGVLLVKENDNFYVAIVDNEGVPKPSSVLAHNAELREEMEIDVIKAQNRLSFDTYRIKETRRQTIMREPIQPSSTVFPHLGKPHVAVILAQFKDVKFTVGEPQKTFDEYLNLKDAPFTDYGNPNINSMSVSQYMRECSFGAFEPQFDVYGPITLGNNMAYYGPGHSDRMDLFLPEVLQRAEDSGVDFSQYDINNDGVLDLVYIIYAGYSASVGNNSEDCIWPKSGTTSISFKPGGKILRRYGVSNELLGTPQGGSYGSYYNYVNGIGLFIHEFSHCMGIPDFYVTGSGSQQCKEADNQTMSYWSIMDSGCYSGTLGSNPIAYLAWEREALEWYDIKKLTANGHYSLKTLDAGGDAYRILVDNDPTGWEYFILENLQKTGIDSKIYGSGLLITHVDYHPSFFTLGGGVNNTLGHPRMTVVAADGCLDALNVTTSKLKGDLFPGSKNNTAISDETAVKWPVYTGTRLGKKLLNITEQGGEVSFDFEDENYVDGILAPEVSSSVNEDNEQIFTIDGRHVGTERTRLSKGIYVIGNKKFVVR